MFTKAFDPTGQRTLQRVFATEATDVLALAAATLSLGLVYWLVRDRDARLRA